MLGPLLLLQVAVAAARVVPTYSTPGLAQFIERAAVANRSAPPTLRGYHARIESELSLLLRDTLGREHSAQIEQVAMNARWRHGGAYSLHVVGYRSVSVGVPYSALSLARNWTVPSLYGDRLTLGVEIARIGGAKTRSRTEEARVSADTSRRRTAAQGTLAVHPFAPDRGRFYRFAGGDTIAFIRSAAHVIPIARVRVTPLLDSIPRDTSISLFDGEIDVDAARYQIVRMRGQVVTRAPTRHGVGAILTQLSGVVAVAFIEFINAEIDGQYWLPQLQRTEFQATLAPLGAQRSIFRLISRFTEIVPDEDRSFLSNTPDVDTLVPTRAAADSARAAARALTYAKGDSISRYNAWQRAPGTATSQVSAADFDDFLPDQWRANGPPRLEFTPNKLDDVFRYDRIEGAYTGAAVALRFRDKAPGVTVCAYPGWAWSEQTLRGGASVAFARGASTLASRVERALVSTNDFAPPLEEGTIGFGGLFGVDDQDYIDRRTAAVSLTMAIGQPRTALIVGEASMGADRSERTRVNRAFIGAGSFRFNRASQDGQYWRGVVTLEMNPDVTGILLDPGIGLAASYEIGRGQLNWDRSEITLAVRRSIGDLMMAARAQGGVVLGRALPPQQLFEIGGENALPGYGYKQFAGDRAAIGGVLANYMLPVLRRPWRIVRSLIVPGIGPGLAAGIQSGWAEASSASTLLTIRRLDPLAPLSCAARPVSTCPPPLSTPTHGVRATADGRLTLFGGLLGFGVARPVDRAARWRWVFRFGQEF